MAASSADDADRVHRAKNVRRLRAPAIALSILFSSGGDAQSASALGTGSSVRIPVSSPHAASAAFSLQAFVYRPTGTQKHPLVLLSHGSSGGDPKQEVPQPDQAKFFTDRGYVVLVPMRRGRGTSGGVSLESEDKNCDPKSWQGGLDAAFEDVTAAIDYARTLPDVDSSKIVLVGESRGGFLSVAYAAEGARRARVVAVVNFVGGWVAQAEDNCPTDFNTVAFRRYGTVTRIPQLWLYGDHDRFYSAASIRSYPRAYASRGGKLTFDLISDVPNNGHWLPGFPQLWSTQVDRYLATRGLPARPRQ